MSQTPEQSGSSQDTEQPQPIGSQVPGQVPADSFFLQVVENARSITEEGIPSDAGVTGRALAEGDVAMMADNELAPGEWPTDFVNLLGLLATNAEKITDVVRKHKAAFGLGAAALAGFILNPGDAARPIEGIVSAGEVFWIAGAGICLAAVGKHVPRNLFKIREAFKDIAAAANNSAWFKLGLAINSLAAAWEGTAPIYYIVTHLPPEAWAAALVPLADLGLTIYGRVIIICGMRASRRQEP